MAGLTNFRFSSVVTLILTAASVSVLADINRCSGWSTTTNYCFRFSDVMVSRSSAVSECQKLSAQLLRFYTLSDVNEFLSVVNVTGETRWWTDLNDFPASGDWVWGQGANVIRAEEEVLRWNSEPDDNMTHLQNCVSLNIQGAISDQRCSDKHSYVCEYSLPAGRSCQNGWTMYQSSCYYFVGASDPWNLKTWYDANSSCANQVKDLKPHLLFLETAAETAYIRQQLPVVQLTAQLWWLGMTDIRQEGLFEWTDGTRAQTGQLNWDNEPNNLGGGEQCGVIYRNGRLGDLNCSRAENYVCMKYRNPYSPVLNKLGCPTGWTRAGHSCYLLNIKQKKTWQDASSTCQQSGAHLVQIDNADEKSWFETQTTLAGTAFWTGLNDLKKTTVWRWSDGSIAKPNLIRWNQEPNNYKGDEDCGAISQSGTFNDVNCLWSLRFICEMHAENMPCPGGWISNSSYDVTACYYVSNMTATDDEAKNQCNLLSAPRSSYLLAINTLPELNFILSTLQALPSTTVSFFTGLTDRGHEGYWQYDTSFNPPPASNLIMWDAMPVYFTGQEHCAYVTDGGRYKNTKCSALAGYMCEKPAAGYTVSGSSSHRVDSKRLQILISGVISALISISILNNLQF